MLIGPGEYQNPASSFRFACENEIFLTFVLVVTPGATTEDDKTKI